MSAVISAVMGGPIIGAAVLIFAYVSITGRRKVSS